MVRSHFQRTRKKILKSIVWVEAIRQLTDRLGRLYFWVKDTSGFFLMANREFVAMSNLDSEDDLIGKTDFDIWPRH